jgi:dual specificity phosphatase 12
MNEIAPGLWLGDIVSAYNTAELKRLGVRSVITAMRGQITIHPVC